MDREILFRGKRFSYLEWVYGYYCCVKEESETSGNDEWHWMIEESGRNWCVDPKTVGQYTGLRDKNGVKIFEGDIVNCKTTAYSFEGGVIIWSAEEARWAMLKGRHRYPVSDFFMYEVIGNIYDNPELLGAK